MTTYNRDQWISSFEGQIAILRPHLTGKLLGTISGAAWVRHGAKGADPIQAARAESAALDGSKGPPAQPPQRRR